MTKTVHWKRGCRYAKNDKNAADDIREITCGQCFRIWRGRVRRSRHYKEDDWRGVKARMPNVYTDPA